MTELVLVAAGLVVATKALDCVTTLRSVGAFGEGETNPLARGPMHRYGVRSVAGVVLVVAVAWTALLATLVLWAGEPWLELAFVVQSLFVAFVHATVAHTNATGRWNPITVRVRAMHRGLGGVLSRARSVW